MRKKRWPLYALLYLLIMIALSACGSQKPALKMIAPRPQAVSQSAMGSVHPSNWGAPVWGPHPGGLAHSARASLSMYDSISLQPLQALDHFALAGYTDGHPSWRTYLPERQAWPLSHVVSIAVFSWHHADCADVESGDMVPSQVVAWVRGDLMAGFAHPCVYSSLWEYTNKIRPLLAAAGIPRTLIFEWDADYTFVPHIDPTFDATQYTDSANGLNADASIVSPGFLSIAQPPYKPRPVCFGPLALHTPGCIFVQKEVARWKAQAAWDLKNAARVTGFWS